MGTPLDVKPGEITVYRIQRRGQEIGLASLYIRTENFGRILGSVQIAEALEATHERGRLSELIDNVYGGRNGNDQRRKPQAQRLTATSQDASHLP